ncbi:MAG: ATP-binding protein, partial [Candidatus Methylomirabilales bacterium]
MIYANRAAARLFGRDSLDHVPVQLIQGGNDVLVQHPIRRELRTASTLLEDGRTLRVMTDVTKARQVEAMRRDFVANASHELKTPVAGILATAETIRSAAAEDPEKVSEFSETLIQDAKRMSRLVQDLLDLARLERGVEPAAPVPLGELLIAEAEAIRNRAEEKGLGLELDVDSQAAVLGVKEDLGLMVRNLLQNALAYTAEGKVEARLYERDGRVVLEVADTGVGIPSYDLGRIFERFYRVDKARFRETGGTGLGLSIVRHVAEMHGGEVSVKSELGVGSTFTLWLPAATPPRLASTLLQTRPRPSEPSFNEEGDRTMRFMMVVKANENSEAGVLPTQEELTSMGKYNEELVKAGALLAGEGLQPSSKGARVKFSGGKPTVVDGPFTEAKELIAGFWLIQVKSKEEA